MNINLLYQNEITISRTSTELTTSHEKNFQIISQHWKSFNSKIYTFGLNQSNDWKKFGVTIKKNGSYYYFTGIPFINATPFESFTIPKGIFSTYEHKGSLNTISSTINKIYINESLRQIIDLNRSLIQYELYDRRFNWNSSHSIVELRVPTLKSIHEELC